MVVPHPLLSPDDDGMDLPPALVERVTQGLSVSEKLLLRFFQKAVRVEVGEDGQSVLQGAPAFNPLSILWLLHFGVLTLHVDHADRVYLVKTDTLNYLLLRIDGRIRPLRRRKR
jgi:hypothetical protein